MCALCRSQPAAASAPIQPLPSPRAGKGRSRGRLLSLGRGYGCGRGRQGAAAGRASDGACALKASGLKPQPAQQPAPPRCEWLHALAEAAAVAGGEAAGGDTTTATDCVSVAAGVAAPQLAEHYPPGNVRAGGIAAAAAPAAAARPAGNRSAGQRFVSASMLAVQGRQGQQAGASEAPAVWRQLLADPESWTAELPAIMRQLAALLVPAAPAGGSAESVAASATLVTQQPAPAAAALAAAPAAAAVPAQAAAQAASATPAADAAASRAGSQAEALQQSPHSSASATAAASCPEPAVDPALLPPPLGALEQELAILQVSCRGTHAGMRLSDVLFVVPHVARRCFVLLPLQYAPQPCPASRTQVCQGSMIVPAAMPW